MTAILLCVTAGRGPAECRMAVAHVAATIAAEADERGFAVASDLAREDAPPASALLSIEGEGAEGFAAGWTGAIQWIAKGAAREHHARRNWFVGVHRLSAPADVIALDVRDVRFEAMRAGGPGGQHQNTTASAVRATHAPTGLSAVARDERSQHRNRARALERLRDLLAARDERRRDAARWREWMTRLSVERGNPVRVYEGDAFRRVK